MVRLKGPGVEQWVQGKHLEWEASDLDFSLALLYGPGSVTAPLWDSVSPSEKTRRVNSMSSEVCVFQPPGRTQSLDCLKRAVAPVKVGSEKGGLCGPCTVQGRRKAIGAGASWPLTCTWANESII